MDSSQVRFSVKILIIGLLLMELLFVYWNHFDNGYFYDDFHIIQENPSITSLRNVPDFFLDKNKFSSEPAFQIHYRPMLLVSFAFDYWIGGGVDTGVSHVTTFVGFVLLILLSLYVFMNLFQKSDARTKCFYFSLLAAFGVAFHPVSADVINYHAVRSVSFATLFGMLALAMYVGSSTARKFHLYLLPLVIACLFRMNAVMFVPILFLYKLFFELEIGLGQVFQREHRQNIYRLFVEMLPALGTAFVLVVFTIIVTDSALYAGQIDRGTYLLTQPSVITNYFSLFFSPGLLNPNGWRDFVTSANDLRFILGVFFLCILVLTIFVTSLYSSTRLVSFGLAWFLLGLLPTSSIFPNVVAQLDYRMFLSSFGLSIAVVEGFRLLERRLWSTLRSIALRGALAIVAVSFVQAMAYASYERSEVWGDSESMWTDVIKKEPTSGRVHMNLGVYLMAKGKYPEAERRFNLAREYSPTYSTIYVNLGILKSARNDPVGAEENFKLAMRHSWGGYPKAQSAYYYARFLHRQQRDQEAIGLLEKARENRTNSRRASYLLMDIYRKRRDPRLIQIARSLLQAYPDDSVALNHLRLLGATK